MQTAMGISRRDYERLPADVKVKVVMLLEGLKAELQHRGFSLSFLGHDGRWKDMSAWRFIELPEDHYRRLITGSKLVRPRRREELLEQISELYDLVKQSPKQEERCLEFWFNNISSS